MDFSPYVKTRCALVANFPALRNLPAVKIPFRNVRLSRSHFGPCFRARGSCVRNGVQDVLIKGVESKESIETMLSH